jgi:Ca2+-binding RTX toxin-like protein
MSPDVVWIYDNVLYADSTTLVDYGGVLFTSNHYEYNIFYDAGHYLLETLNPQGILNPGAAGSFTISEVPADHPITVTATDSHGMAVSESFQLQVGDSGPTATAIADQRTYAGQHFSLDVSSHFGVPVVDDTLTSSGSIPAGLSIDARTGIISGVTTQGDFGDNPITVAAIDAHGMTISETFDDHAPMIVSNGAGAMVSVDVAENANSVTNVMATDADAGSTLTHSIAGGADAAEFAINAWTGGLSLVSSPDYEHPTDAGGNNVYDVVVRVSDGTLADTQAVAVTVDDLAEHIRLGNGGVTFTDTGVTELSITDGTGNDTITGTAGVDHLYGGGGNDTIAGGGGADILDGGTGMDTVDYSASFTGVIVNLATSGIQSGGDVLSNFEKITGSAFNDTLIGDAGANMLSGGAGDDVLIGGGTGNMLINGSFEADHIAVGSWAPSATLTGWTAASDDFETWNHLTVGGYTYTASEGVQSIELDSGKGLDSFYQEFQTDSGAQYTLSLDAAMRADAPSSSGTIEV